MKKCKTGCGLKTGGAVPKAKGKATGAKGAMPPFMAKAMTKKAAKKK